MNNFCITTIENERKKKRIKRDGKGNKENLNNLMKKTKHTIKNGKKRKSTLHRKTQ